MGADGTFFWGFGPLVDWNSKLISWNSWWRRGADRGGELETNSSSSAVALEWEGGEGGSQPLFFVSASLGMLFSRFFVAPNDEQRSLFFLMGAWERRNLVMNNNRREELINDGESLAWRGRKIIKPREKFPCHRLWCVALTTLAAGRWASGFNERAEWVWWGILCGWNRVSECHVDEV